MVDVIEVEGARLDGIGHREQHLAIARHAFVTMEDVHFTKTQPALENVLQQRRTTETVRITANDVDDEYFLDGRQFLLRLVFPFLVIPYTLLLRATILDGRRGVYYAFQRGVAELLLSLLLLERDLRRLSGRRQS